MTTPTKYTYNLTTDFTGLTEEEISTTALTDEIRDSSISIALDYINTSSDDCDIWFKDILSSGDQSTLSGVVASHTGILPVPEQITTISGQVQLTNSINLNHPQTSDQLIRVAIEKSDTDFITLYTHNWCDPTSWYQNSIEVVSGVATDTGDHLNYTISGNVIDTYHGKLSGEDYLVDNNGHSYRVSVWVNGELQTEDCPCPEHDGDYCINYPSGIIQFHDTLDPADEVTATYHYATNGDFTVSAATGKVLKLGMVEVQMTGDIDLTDTLKFTMYGLVDVFAPQYLTTNGGPYPPGTKIPLANSLVFKTITDYFNDTIKSYPAYPALGGNSWRGCSQPIYVMDWDYVRNRVMYGNYGMEIRMELVANVPFGGTYATATFYCTTENA